MQVEKNMDLYMVQNKEHATHALLLMSAALLLMFAQEENLQVEKNMDLYMVQNKELAGRAAQLRATAAAMEAANAAMSSFLAAVQVCVCVRASVCVCVCVCVFARCAVEGYSSNGGSECSYELLPGWCAGV